MLQYKKLLLKDPPPQILTKHFFGLFDWGRRVEGETKTGSLRSKERNERKNSEMNEQCDKRK